MIALAAGALAAVLTVRADRRRHRGDVVRSDVDRAVDALAALRNGYRTRAFGEPIGDLELTRLEDALDLAVQRTTQPVVDAARRYVAVARLYASGDPDTGDAAEQAAYEELAAALLAERKAYA